MDKDQKASEREENTQEQGSEESNTEHGGFPDDMDFKKFLGCGG